MDMEKKEVRRFNLVGILNFLAGTGVSPFKVKVQATCSGL